MNLNQKLQVWQATSESSSKFQQAPLKCKSTPNIKYESQKIKENKEQKCRLKENQNKLKKNQNKIYIHHMKSRPFGK
jgi:hypothetical protein